MADSATNNEKYYSYKELITKYGVRIPENIKDYNFNGKLIWPLPKFQPINNYSK